MWGRKKKDIFDAEASEDARDEGMDQVVENNKEWGEDLRRFIEDLPIGWRGTGEDIRRLAVPDIGRPKSPNAWGGVIGGAATRGLLTRTGNRPKMKSVSSHARKTDEYERC